MHLKKENLKNRKAKKTNKNLRRLVNLKPRRKEIKKLNKPILNLISKLAVIRQQGMVDQ